jgi:hypothetical protein
MATEYTEHTEYEAAPRSVTLIARLIPASERESVVGDLVEEASFRGLGGARRTAWLTTECAAIAAGLSMERARTLIVVPPVREVVSGLAIDARGALHGGAAATLLRACVFVASIATLVLGVELLVASLMAAAGF